MVFSSSLFIFYFLPVFLLLYLLADKKYKNYIALAGSLIFFIWGAPLFIFVVLLSILFNFLVALFIHKLNGVQRKALFILSVCLNVGVLLLLQYTGFFIKTINVFLAEPGISQMGWMKILLPVGLSFITFHQISYLIDVHRETVPPIKKLVNYSLFILFFPQLISGPIIRAGQIAGQIEDRSSNYNIDNKLQGFIRFIIGLSKKVLIANVLGTEVDRIFAMNGTELTTPLAWIGIVAYAIQIYFDFAGYSDMAIGLARMMGFIFPENFNNPYISQNVTEFWRRWHMTLSSWLRDYLFMPMSVSMRNRGKAGIVISIMVTFIICGMWHQPGWTFIIWGAWHGFWMVLDQLFLIKLLKKTGRIFSIVFTFFITTVGWVFFRTENLKHSRLFLKRMFLFNNNTNEWGFKTDFWVMLAIGGLFSFIVATKFGEKLQAMTFEKAYSLKRLAVFGILAIILFIICIGSITSSGFNPFIYFRF
jgi:alginate O-acetyltransferase complex protein AlgI